MAATEFRCPGMPDAIDACAVSTDGKLAFLFDRSCGCVVRINLQTGDRTKLNWQERNYGSTRFLCYSMFQWKRLEDGLGPDRVALLLFDSKYQHFRLVLTIVTPDNGLKTLREHQIVISNIKPERLAYSAHKHGGRLEIIFYEHFDRTSVQMRTKLNFAFFAVELFNLEMCRRKTGSLPVPGRWELPFVREMKLYFVSMSSSGHKLACLPMNQAGPDVMWTVYELGTTDDNQSPSHRSTICHAWEFGTVFFTCVSKTPTNVELTLWSIDTIAKRWSKIPYSQQLPHCATNFAARSTVNSLLFVHFNDSSTTAVFHKFDLAEYVASVRRSRITESVDALEQPETSRNYADVTCPICLETYTDPRTLFCGHSLCFACLVRLRESGGSGSKDVKCPNCRKVTKVPEGGLPTNYSLQEAIELIQKTQQLCDAGFRCRDCHETITLAIAWVCATCLPEFPLDLPESATMLCANCVIKKHSRHQSSSFTEFQKYCKDLKAFKSDSEEKIGKTAEEVGQQLQKILETQVIQKLVLTAEKIVGNFCNEKILHSENALARERAEIDETLTRVAEKLIEQAPEVLTKMLEAAVLEGDRPPPPPTASPPPSLTDEELSEQLLRI